MTIRRFWVFIEQEEGKANPVSWELLGAMNRLAAEVKDEADANGDEVVVEGVVAVCGRSWITANVIARRTAIPTTANAICFLAILPP